MALVGDRWERVTYERRLYQIEGSNPVSDNSDLEAVPLFLLQDKKITKNLECPSIVFVILPDEKAEYYI